MTRYNLNSVNRELLAEVGKHLQFSRENKGLTISQLAKMSGVSRGTLYAAERGDVTYWLILWVYVKLCGADILYIDQCINLDIKFIGDGNGK